METRNVTIILGDWSGDGHNETEKVHLILSGNDVGDAALAQNRKAFEKATRLDAKELFSEYEHNFLRAEDFITLLESGIKFKDANGGTRLDKSFDLALDDPSLINELNEQGTKAYWVDTKGESHMHHYMLSAGDLLMQILGFGDSSFSYEVIPDPDYPVIVGDYRHSGNKPEMPLSSFGYGLFL